MNQACAASVDVCTGNKEVQLCLFPTSRPIC